MGFGEAIKTCFGKYASFTGRARRSEFWWFFLFWWLGTVIINLIDNAAGLVLNLGTDTIDTSSGVITFTSGGLGILSTIWGLVLLLPFLSVTVRRLHDTNRSGWWWWIQLIPCVGFIVILVFMLLDSTPGDNRFGPNPKGYAPLM
jgi:uncharacterized membrane protein YhaH (DUF805 family)